jgi:hypothetical protein
MKKARSFLTGLKKTNLTGFTDNASRYGNDTAVDNSDGRPNSHDRHNNCRSPNALVPLQLPLGRGRVGNYHAVLDDNPCHNLPAQGLA